MGRSFDHRQRRPLAGCRDLSAGHRGSVDDVQLVITERWLDCLHRPELISRRRPSNEGDGGPLDVH